MVDTAVHIKGRGGQEILIDKEFLRNFLMGMLFFSFLHSFRGT